MFNSDGYILLDFTGVDITKSNQYLKGIYQRVINSIDTNKLALVINAGDLTPQAAIIHKRLNFYVITTSLYIFTVNSNDIIIIEQAGQSQVDVAIVPTLTEGVKVADYTIGAVEGSIYAPEFQTEINDNVTASNTTWSSNKISADLALKANTASLASVATTGDYDDLLNKPSIPTKTSDLTNDSGFITSAQVPTIDDNAVASDKVWSSYKTSTEIGTKANSTDVYTKSEIDTSLASKANSADVYTKTEVDNVVATKQNSNVLNIRKTYPANTTIVNVILDCIATYGKVSMMIGAVIMGYGFIHINCIFSDDGQGGGTIVANNKAQNNTQAALWAFQYINGTITLSYVYN